jgi:DNA-directed RNA polymerase III subunit RPC2
MNSGIITNGLKDSLSSGHWSIKRFKVEKKGVTQILTRLSYIGALGMMTRLMSNIEKSRKVSGPRSLQGSHWGILCPSDTPDGENCGLVKNLALLAHLTHETPEIPILDLLITLGVEEIGNFSGLEINYHQNCLVFLNGLIIGLHRYPQYLVKRFRKERRRGQVGEFVSINHDLQRHSVNISSDGGRLCRPYIIVKDKKPLLTADQIEKVEREELSFQDLLNIGVIEYLDVNEEDNSLIALKEETITENTSHLEIS